MSSSTNQLTATVKGNRENLRNIVFRELTNGSVELTLSGIDKCNEWMVVNSTTIIITRDGNSDIETSIFLPELPCFDDAIRYERCSKDEFSILYVPIKSLEKPLQEHEMLLTVSQP